MVTENDITPRKCYSMDLPQGICGCQPVGGIVRSSPPLLQLRYRGTRMVEGEEEREGEGGGGGRERKGKKGKRGEGDE